MWKRCCIFLLYMLQESALRRALKSSCAIKRGLATQDHGSRPKIVLFRILYVHKLRIFLKDMVSQPNTFPERALSSNNLSTGEYLPELRYRPMFSVLAQKTRPGEWQHFHSDWCFTLFTIHLRSSSHLTSS